MRAGAGYVFLFFCCLAVTSLGCAISRHEGPEIVVAQDGSGNFRTIQDAINSLSDSSETQRKILIRKGEYPEKIFISKHMITLEGEDPKTTIISFPIAREIWRCENPDDWGAAVLNLKGNDLTFKNLTVINTYGFEDPEDVVLECKGLNGEIEKRTISKNTHQFALRSFESTRLQAVNCIFRSYAGDTVSPWNDTTGMYYFRDCVMEGGVDFYCPRGWAWAENIEFICKSKTAAIWHDGSKDPESRSVIVNSSFRGVDGFKLGRYHRDARIYLIGNRFAESMADAPVYRNESPAEVLWGHRIYYQGNRRGGGDYTWMKDNLESAPGSPKVKEVTIEWTFGGKWYPSEAAK